VNAHLPSASVAETTYDAIRNDIVFGRLKPGEKLKLERLKTRYGASVSTHREILSRLAADGLVVAEGQRGFEVTPVSLKNLRELSDLRKVLECAALELSFAAGDMDWEGHVVAAHHKLQQMEREMAAGNRAVKESWKRYDWEFHQALISACGSRELMTVHAGVFDKYLRYQMMALTFRGQPAIDEHRALLEAALERDVSAAQTTLRRHIDGGVLHCLDAGALDRAA
jgi:DNA-binding GntR family transcriptional regulator